VKRDVLLFSLFSPDKLGFPVVYSKKVLHHPRASQLVLRIYQTIPAGPQTRKQIAGGTGRSASARRAR